MFIIPYTVPFRSILLWNDVIRTLQRYGMVHPVGCAGEAFFLISFILTAEKFI